MISGAQSLTQECLFQDDLNQSNCPICLEPIFEEVGERHIEKPWDSNEDFNLTILCSHTFNWKCLLGWGGDKVNQDEVHTCPLCRYYQNPQQLNHCDECGVTDNYFEQLIESRNQQQIFENDLKQFTLWTCLVCGHIGCLNLMTKLSPEEQQILETVQKGHAYSHYEDSRHVYAMEIESKKVWDFSKENFVNRLVQNEIDGKLVEVGEEQIM